MEFPARIIVAIIVLSLAWGAAGLLTRYFSHGRLPSRFDRSDLPLSKSGPVLVQFTSPYCLECKEILPMLETASASRDAGLAVIDAKDRPDLAAKYAIRSTPTILVVDEKGDVAAGWHTSPSEHDLLRALEAAAI